MGRDRMHQMSLGAKSVADRGSTVSICGPGVPAWGGDDWPHVSVRSSIVREVFLLPRKRDPTMLWTSHQAQIHTKSSTNNFHATKSSTKTRSHTDKSIGINGNRYQILGPDD